MIKGVVFRKTQTGKQTTNRKINRTERLLFIFLPLLKKPKILDWNIFAPISPTPSSPPPPPLLYPTHFQRKILRTSSPYSPYLLLNFKSIQQLSVEFVLCLISLCEALSCSTVGVKCFSRNIPHIIPTLLQNAEFLSIYNSASPEISLAKRNLNKCMSHRKFTVLLLPLI